MRPTLQRAVERGQPPKEFTDHFITVTELLIWYCQKYGVRLLGSHIKAAVNDPDGPAYFKVANTYVFRTDEAKEYFSDQRDRQTRGRKAA